MLKILRFLVILAWIAPVGPAAADDVAALKQRWAELKYLHPTDRDRVAQSEALEGEAAALAEREPSARTLLLQADIINLTAEFMHSTASLGKVRAARDILLTALQSEPENPAVLAALGSVYYEVPGWPIGFGDRKKAEAYLRKAIALAPDDRDTNFFMGDMLLATGRAGQAVPYLEKALAASQQGSVFDRGRHDEIASALAKARHRIRR
jgi:predicted Zn-dependent protease